MVLLPLSDIFYLSMKMGKFPSLESYEGYVEFNLQMPILLSVNVLPHLNVKKL